MKVTLGLVPDTAIESAVSIDKFSVTYCQNADTNSKREDYQFLTIEAQNSGAGEDGWYFNLKIDSHWSIDDPQELVNLIEDFKKRLELNITAEKDIKTYDDI